MSTNNIKRRVHPPEFGVQEKYTICFRSVFTLFRLKSGD